MTSHFVLISGASLAGCVVILSLGWYFINIFEITRNYIKTDLIYFYQIIRKIKHFKESKVAKFPVTQSHFLPVFKFIYVNK